MGFTTETEELKNEKAQLTRMLQSLENEEKWLRNKLRIVEEKISIQHLRQKVNAKREVVAQLKSKLRELEGRLNAPQKKEPVEVMVKAAPADSHKPENQHEIKIRRGF